MPRFAAPFLTGLGLALLLAVAPAQAALKVPGNPAAVGAYAGVLRKINPQMPVWQSRALATHLLFNAHRWKIDANLLVALLSVESSWHTHARSWAGAIGLGQLMPETAAKLHVNPTDPYENIQGAARYLGEMLNKYRNKPNRYQLSFAAYNAGPQAVSEYGGIPPYAETQYYVVKVMRAWKHFTRIVHIPRQRIRPAATMIADNSPDVSYWASSVR